MRLEDEGDRACVICGYVLYKRQEQGSAWWPAGGDWHVFHRNDKGKKRIGSQVGDL